jgi:hypothetical protein
MSETCTNYNDDEIDIIMRYNSLMENYKEALCELINYVQNLNIVPIGVKIKIPFIKNYIKDDENDSDLLGNGLCYLLENKDIILNFNFDNVVDFGDYYNQIAGQNQFIDLIDEFINSIKKNKNKILKKNIKIIKKIFEYIFETLEKINVIFNK